MTTNLNQNRNDSSIHFIMTGGTIDSYYDSIKETAVPSEHSYIPKFIQMLKLYEECIFSEVCMKDSRNLALEDREKMIQEINGSSSQRIIITHGSYTASDTARYLHTTLTVKDKIIIIVCSMIPLEGFALTDAGFNLGYAIAKSQELDPGVYVCMNGRVFSPDEVTKILSEGRFGSIYTK